MESGGRQRARSGFINTVHGRREKDGRPFAVPCSCCALGTGQSMGCAFSWLYSGSKRVEAFGASLEVLSTLGEGAFSTVFLVRSSVQIKQHAPGLFGDAAAPTQGCPSALLPCVLWSASHHFLLSLGPSPAVAALKQMMVPRESLHLLERETRAHEQLAGHPHLLELVAHEQRGTANADVAEALLLFPYCDGGTLEAALRQAAARGGYTEADALDITGQMA